MGVKNPDFCSTYFMEEALLALVTDSLSKNRQATILRDKIRNFIKTTKNFNEKNTNDPNISILMCFINETICRFSAVTQQYENENGPIYHDDNDIA